jgi:hypothetical protein
MPNNECPNEKKITAEANKALADLKKVTDAQPDLVLKLESITDGLTIMASHRHKPQ